MENTSGSDGAAIVLIPSVSAEAAPATTTVTEGDVEIELIPATSASIAPSTARPTAPPAARSTVPPAARSTAANKAPALAAPVHRDAEQNTEAPATTTVTEGDVEIELIPATSASIAPSTAASTPSTAASTVANDAPAYSAPVLSDAEQNAEALPVVDDGGANRNSAPSMTAAAVPDAALDAALDNAAPATLAAGGASATMWWLIAAAVLLVVGVGFALVARKRRVRVDR